MWVLIYVSTILFYALCLWYFFFIFSFSPFFCLLFDWWDFFISSPLYFPQWFGTLFLCFQKVCLSFYDACLNNQSLKLMNVLVCIVVAQLLSHVWFLATPWTAARLTSHCPLHLLEFSYVHVHWISDAIEPSHPLSPSSPSAFNLSQHQGFFQMSQVFASCGLSIGASVSASVLPKSFQGRFPLRLIGSLSLLSKGFSRVFSSTTVWKHQIFSILPSTLSSSNIHTWLLERP